MKIICPQCKKSFNGRSDKKFCSVACKNKYNFIKRQNTKSYTKEIDNYLHRNREILEILMANSKKETFDKLMLTKAGFKFQFMTGIYINKEGKMYHYIYDFAWMDFTDQRVLIVKK